MNSDLRKPSFLSRVKEAWNRKMPNGGYALLVAFLLPFAIMFGVYACLGKHPFGNQSILTLDLQAQYIYYYEAIRRLLTEGGSWLYSWQRTLGGEFMGIVAYYMGSPFNLILLLFPKANVPDAVMFIQLAKVGAMGLNFAIYLRRTRRTGDITTVTFATMYALCAYSVVNLMNPMWLDAMVFLPLLILGVESMIREKKFILYTASLIVIYCSNYYMGYMCSIFTLCYFIYYYFLVCDELPQNPGAEEGNSLHRLLHSRGMETLCRFALFTFTAVLASAFMLWCAWYSLNFGKTGFATTDFGFRLRFDFLDLFVKMLPGSYDTIRPNGLPMIYSGLLTLIAMPLYYMSPAISRKKKFLTTGLLAVLLVSFVVNTIDLVWHGFSTPQWLDYRYSYLFSFVAVVMACDAIRTLKAIKLSGIVMTGAFIGLATLVVQKLNYTFEQGTKSKVLDDAQCIALTLILLAAYMIALYFLKKEKCSETSAFVLAVVVCVEMFAGALINIADVEKDVGTVKYGNYVSDSGKTEYYDGYVGSVKRLESIVHAVKDADPSFYRMETTVYRRLGGVNEQMAVGFNGISHSTSTLNKPLITLFDRFGYASTAHWTKYIGGTPISDALLGIKYLITKNQMLDKNIFTVVSSEPEYYEYVVSRNTIYALQNTKALSVAYGVSPALEAETEGILYPPYYNPLEWQNRIVNAMVSGVSENTPNVLKGLKATTEAVNCGQSFLSHSHKYTDENGEEQSATNSYFFIDGGESGESIFRFCLTAEADGDIFAHFPGVLFQGMSTTCGLYVNNYKVSDYFTNETWVIQNLGNFSKGDEVVVELRFTGGDMYISRASKYYFYYIDYEAMNEAFDLLDTASMFVEDYGNDYLKGTIDLPEGQELIFTSIPYDEGWRVKIDGEKAEPIKIMGALLAVPSTAGFHEIEFVYRPNCAVYGGILSLIGLALFALLIVWSTVLGKRKKAEADGTHFFYHKGDATVGWLLEAAETVCADSADAEKPDEAPAEPDEAPAEPDEASAEAESSDEETPDGGAQA